jgi:hypothetical protein
MVHDALPYLHKRNVERPQCWEFYNNLWGARTRNRVVEAARENFITFKESKNRFQEISPGSIAWQAGTTTLFLLGSYPIDCLKIPARAT